MLTVLIISALAVALLATLGFNSAFIPGPVDEKTRLEPAGTNKTADFVGTTLNLGTGYAPGGPGQAFCALVDVAAVDRTTGDETYAWKVQESADGSTWTDASPTVNITAAGAFSLPCFISQPNVRLWLDVGGTTPSVTYEAWLVPLH